MRYEVRLFVTEVRTYFVNADSEIGARDVVEELVAHDAKPDDVASDTTDVEVVEITSAQKGA